MLLSVAVRESGIGTNLKCRRAPQISGPKVKRTLRTPFQDPGLPCPDVLCFKLHCVVLRLLGRTT
jgi:hypothetical protein